jgi:GntR family transcriptional regulator / MocR family aminotransferase
VFYVGTFSKCMLPALRLGYLVAPQWAMQTLVAAKNCLDWHCSTPIQKAVAGFIVGGHLARHVRKMRQVYNSRRPFLVNFLKEQLGEWLEPIASSYGMHIAAEWNGCADLDDIAQALLRSNVKIHTWRRYYLGPQKKNGLIFGYGAADLPELSNGLAALRKVLGAGRVKLAGRRP